MKIASVEVAQCPVVLAFSYDGVHLRQTSTMTGFQLGRAQPSGLSYDRFRGDWVPVTWLIGWLIGYQMKWVIPLVSYYARAIREEKEKDSDTEIEHHQRAGASFQESRLG